MTTINKNEFDQLVEYFKNEGQIVYNRISRFQRSPEDRAAWLYNYIQAKLYKWLGPSSQVKVINVEESV